MNLNKSKLNVYIIHYYKTMYQFMFLKYKLTRNNKPVFMIFLITFSFNNSKVYPRLNFGSARGSYGKKIVLA